MAILVDEIKKSASVRRGRGFEGGQKGGVQVYESLEDDGSIGGPQRSVEVWLIGRNSD